MKRYTKMEYENPDEMTFGFSKHPVKTKNGLEIGAGYVNPIIKVAPKKEVKIQKTPWYQNVEILQ